jgi:alpha-ketoglutarate-dependent 2,4-dichlorophenoxyacetate dioxygenase
MAISIKAMDPVGHPEFFGVVGGIDLRKPVAEGDVAAIIAGMDRFGVLLFRDQALDDDQQIAFSRNFGQLEHATGDAQQGPHRRLKMEVNDVSNLDEGNRKMARDDRRLLLNLGSRHWHTDSSFKEIPAKYSLLSGRTIPSAGGNTEFADMRAAYEALPDDLKLTVKDLTCEHSQIYSRGKLGFTTTDFTPAELQGFRPVQQRLVRRHPVTQRKSLYLASHAGTVVGWPKAEARVFLDDLTEHATQRQFVYAHTWRQYDLVMWDNRVTMHRGRRYDGSEVRDMHRTTVADVASTLEQAV